MDHSTYDFAIIGSGVSGGRMAFELASSGARCVLIEAGKAFEAKTFPQNEMDYSTQLFWGGGIELSSDGRLGFLRAKCLGGTSIVNQALVDRFDENALDDWKDRSGVSLFDLNRMAPLYEKVESQMQMKIIPEEYRNGNARAFIKAYDKMGVKWAPLRRAQGDCKTEKGSDCIVCLGGCPRNSKQSSLVTTIRRAKEKNLHVISEFEVQQVLDQGYRVRIFGIQGKSKIRSEIKARKIVLAGGSLGNVAILLRSGFGERLPALGKYFSCHPQFMTYGVFDEPVDAHKGAFQAVKSADPKLRKAGYKFENVFASPIGTAMLIPGFGKSHLENMKKYRYLTSMEIALRDENVGKISLQKNGSLKIEKQLTHQDKGRLKEGLDLMNELFASIGAKKLIRGKQGFGLHLMGGCAIGEDPQRSVINPDFEVHGHPNITIADSSIFPSAPGINPSLTIMALSHYAGERLARR